jgi:Na+/melibiose symporter-like transporter
MPMLVGLLVVAVSSAPMYFIQTDLRVLIYVFAAVQGVGLAIL